ncbi:hypothetical protein ABEV55_14700 [Aneurinibacillus thermoaerophilus]|uniref:hypothetical protein n=1 Tax=Aneurinibacillus thermoaerophilus TaxID=143495 RepID=UPI002E1E799D|nr:hypothetical protein [Aneurinibacillus thermoaerophilus]
MAVSKEDVIKLFELLPEDAKQSAFDYLQFLSIRYTRPNWTEIDKMEPDTEPLTEEEIRQMKSDAGYVTGEEAKREFGLQVDLP